MKQPGIERACLKEPISRYRGRWKPERHSRSLQCELGTRKQNALYESKGHQLRNGADPYDVLQFDGRKVKMQPD
ncbi:jg22457 [Pararge aegeria aegeria]|uniref:Jg22457 protein n=1 Tax=Pararge aegeria aegeria TaxID=348720 RepID=A0A8S4QQQ9_9NEOP|nr:jg22457 [Pararge aegeria aegeria]